jgi:transketolase
LPLSVGTAISAKLDDKTFRVFTLLGDGELPEGSNWEAFLTASHYKLDNLCAILDYNKLQITGTTASVCNTEPIADKLKSFGWAVREVDGHDVEQLSLLFNALPFEKGKPNFIIAHTVKGKGVSFMENQVKWHHGVPSESQYQMAISEINN